MQMACFVLRQLKTFPFNFILERLKVHLDQDLVLGLGRHDSIWNLLKLSVRWDMNEEVNVCVWGAERQYSVRAFPLNAADLGQARVLSPASHLVPGACQR